MAMQGLLANHVRDVNLQFSVEIADKLIEELDKEK
jgi:hypothetical protein